MLFKDHTTQGNIFWATDNYAHRGAGYQYSDPITIEAITGENGSVIVPRALKSRQQQQQRSREMAEVFTPSWICNKQNNLVDPKLRIVSENTDKSGEWLAAAKAALRSTYGFEWQGDNLVLAHENLLYTICDFYRVKFGRELPKQSLPGIAYIISWNTWQFPQSPYKDR